MSYIFEYDGYVDGEPVRPKWIKVITDANAVEQRTVLNFENKEELATLTIAQVYEHLDNLVQYIKDVSQELSPIGIEEQIPKDKWHFKGNWGEIEWARDEAFKWWNLVYYRNEEE